jgi:hypothetical protein
LCRAIAALAARLELGHINETPGGLRHRVQDLGRHQAAAQARQ